MPGPNPPEFTSEVVAYSNGAILLAQTAPIYAIAAAVVLARCYTRLMIVKSFGLDDWAMVATLIFATICFLAYTMEIHHGVGKHIAVIQSDEHGYAQLLKWRMVHMVVVGLGLAMVKISVCLFLLRLATRRAYSWFLWGVIAFLVPFACACALTLIFQCNPVAAAWHVKLLPPPLGTGNAKCFSPATFDAIGLFNGIVNIITDFMLALLPVPLIWKLQMPLGSRISLVAVLSLGIFAAIAGIIRQLSSSQFGISEPYIHDTYSIWNFIELDMGIVAASLPSLRPLVSWLGDAARSISGRTAKTTGYKSRVGEGYQRRARPSDGEDFDMADYGSGEDMKISAVPIKRADNWIVDGAKSSEESILPREERARSGIVVTTRVQIR